MTWPTNVFDRQEILQKAKERYFKEKSAKYYLQNKQAIKEKSKEWNKNLPQKEKDKTKEYHRKKVPRTDSAKKKGYKINEHCFWLV